jgi:Ca-activated chloride channel family protein
VIRTYLQDVDFAHPQFLWLLALLPLAAVWHFRRRDAAPVLPVASAGRFDAPASWRARFSGFPPILRLLTLACLIVALARPQKQGSRQWVEGEGVDIVLCIDVSGSMLAQDFLPNRLEAAKEVAARFVSGRPADRFGLVVFAGEGFTQSPLTADHEALRQQLYGVRGGFMADGTAIGSGLATGVDRLREARSKSKVVILLTDGENNGGLIDPLTAKDMARSLGVKVYTVGIGSEGVAPTPVRGPDGSITLQSQPVNIDESLLRRIAQETGGVYYRATDLKALTSVYAEIDKLEKSRFERLSATTTRARFHPFAWAAVVLLLLEALFRYRVSRVFP